MYDLKICPKGEINNAIVWGCTHILSIQDAEEMDYPVGTPFGIPAANHKRFFFDDLSNDAEVRESNRLAGLMRRVPPSPKIVEAMLDFAKTVPEEGRLLVHCFAGVSRSTATGYMINCWGMPEVPEQACLRITNFQAVNKPVIPNELIVRYADVILKRKGKMLMALDEWTMGGKRGII